MKENISKCSDEQSVLLKNEQNLQKQIDDVKQEIKSLYVLVGIGIACSAKGTVPGSLADISSMVNAADGSSAQEVEDSRDSFFESDKSMTEIQSASTPSGKEDVAKTSPKGFSKGSSQCSKFIRVGKS